jgi:hypothetical protein
MEKTKKNKKNFDNKEYEERTRRFLFLFLSLSLSLSEVCVCASERERERERKSLSCFDEECDEIIFFNFLFSLNAQNRTQNVVL